MTTRALSTGQAAICRRERRSPVRGSTTAAASRHRLASGVGLFRGARDHARSSFDALKEPWNELVARMGCPKENLLSLGMELPVFPALSRERPAPDRHGPAFLGQDRRHRPALRARRSPLRLPGAGGRHHRGRDRRLPEHPGAPGPPSRPGRCRGARLSARKERAVWDVIDISQLCSRAIPRHSTSSTSPSPTSTGRCASRP